MRFGTDDNDDFDLTSIEPSSRLLGAQLLLCAQNCVA